jgi:hypothetical protein
VKPVTATPCKQHGWSIYRHARLHHRSPWNAEELGVVPLARDLQIHNCDLCGNSVYSSQLRRPYGAGIEHTTRGPRDKRRDEELWRSRSVGAENSQATFLDLSHDLISHYSLTPIGIQSTEKLISNTGVSHRIVEMI